MPRRYLTIQDCRSLFNNDSLASQYLTELIRFSIQEKKTSLKIENFTAQYDYLRKLELIKAEFDKFFILDYGALPVCYVLSEIAEELMGVSLPTDPVAALAFVNRFAELIRQPSPRTFWYQDLETRLKSYVLLWLHELCNVDVTGFIQSITKEMKENNVALRVLDLTYEYVFPYLQDNIEKQYKTILLLLSSDTTKDKGLDAVKDLGEVNPDKAALLYDYAKLNEGIKHRGLFTHFLKSLYSSDQDRYLKDTMDLHETNPVESIMAISCLAMDFNKDAHINAAFEFIPTP